MVQRQQWRQRMTLTRLPLALCATVHAREHQHAAGRRQVRRGRAEDGGAGDSGPAVHQAVKRPARRRYSLHGGAGAELSVCVIGAGGTYSSGTAVPSLLRQPATSVSQLIAHAWCHGRLASRPRRRFRAVARSSAGEQRRRVGRRGPEPRCAGHALQHAVRVGQPPARHRVRHAPARGAALVHVRVRRAVVRLGAASKDEQRQKSVRVRQCGVTTTRLIVVVPSGSKSTTSASDPTARCPFRG